MTDRDERDPRPDPVRALWLSGQREHRFGTNEDREPTSAVGRALIAALRAAGLGGDPMTTDPKDAA